LRTRTDLLGTFLGGWQISGVLTAHSGFPWTPITNQACFNTPGNQFLCPTRPVHYLGGGAHEDFTNDTFLRPNGNFPGGGTAFFDITSNAGAQFRPGIGRNSFRGPRYQSVDMALAKNFRFPLFSETANFQFRANFFNIFNKLNLAPFGFNTPSTTVESQYFGSAEPDNGGLSGRVIEFQARLSF